MNIGERIALLHEELKFEDERQDVLYPEYHRLYDLKPGDLEKSLTAKEKQELLGLNGERQRKESQDLAGPPELLAWNSAEETESNLHTFLQDLRKTKDIVKQIIEIINKAKR